MTRAMKKRKFTREKVYCPDVGRYKYLYASEKDAQYDVKKALHSQGEYSIRSSYFCPQCQGWHTTHYKPYYEKYTAEDIKKESFRYLSRILRALRSSIELLHEKDAKKENIVEDLIEAIYWGWEMEHDDQIDDSCFDHLRMLLKYFSIEVLQIVRENYNNQGRYESLSIDLRDYILQKWEYVKGFLPQALFDKNPKPSIPRIAFAKQNIQVFGERDVELYIRGLQCVKKKYLNRILKKSSIEEEIELESIIRLINTVGLKEELKKLQKE